MRVVLFSEGRAGTLAFQALRHEHDVAAWFVPQHRGLRPWLRRIGSGQKSVPRSALASLDLTRFRADILCISGFPWILPPSLLRIPAINAHPSLLPRHRGPLPLFWVYHSNDLRTGVSVHRVVESADAGPLLLQESFDLPRGLPVADLALKKQVMAGEMLRRALHDIAADRVVETPQDPSLATTAPKVKRGTKTIDFASWEVERVWHMLHGLHPFHREPVGADYASVGRFEATDSPREPGSLETVEGGWRLHCLGGYVELFA
jgi:methionyl-tRNA formyltransferase